ncbi:hypothetical protein PTSG_06302 [Salpingoeca rosetta]|uniref:Uncharacterized protein n=1 Tax=Salpingoeca rosetta (strain ATCC 50818 / BSB-021) TaxID=946362 RepID=F2UCI6_SALR5|nr:uncharacterized protein PTSG_06302 [Salpingoeca rosetta]EGD74293.1 hypothetical protein PTSG_06302 [Salpingoeca rosetta]|eukprot:XP_004993193.1 hypothetical protein PTSG_06302 [Salpingoeca rosetta]
MVEPLQTLDTMHTDMVHDAQLDFYGDRLATCSTDKTIKIFRVKEGRHELEQTVQGHSGPVWQVAWANPKHGNYLASCSADKTVIIWEEVESGWIAAHRHTDPKAGSMNTIAWSPHEDALQLAIGTSEGQISLLTLTDGQWHFSEVAHHDDPAFLNGVLGISWAPPSVAFTHADVHGEYRLVACGCDTEVKIYKGTREQGHETVWDEEERLPVVHQSWVRDVSWAPQIGLAAATIASCGQDNAVFVYSKDHASGEWHAQQLGDTADLPVWRVSWSLAGNVLAVACGDSTGVTKLYKQNLNGRWNCIKTIKDPSPPPNSTTHTTDQPNTMPV